MYFQKPARMRGRIFSEPGIHPCVTDAERGIDGKDNRVKGCIGIGTIKKLPGKTLFFESYHVAYDDVSDHIEMGSQYRCTVEVDSGIKADEDFGSERQ